MSRAGLRTRLLIATVVAGGAAAVAVAFTLFPPATADLTPLVVALVAVTVAAELIAIRFPHGTQSEVITLTELAVVADIALLPPALAVGVALVGVAIALVLQRRSPVKALFNLGQYALGFVFAAAVFHGIGLGAVDTTAGLAALAAGAIGFTAVNLVTISAILAATQQRSFAAVLREEGRLSLAIGVGGISIGIVAVSQFLTRPVLVPFVLAPTLALHLAFRGWVKQRELSAGMAEEKTKLERIVEHSSEGIVLTDEAGRVALWSPSMERMTGVPAAEAAGKQVGYLLRGRGLHGEAVSVDVTAQADTFDLELILPDGEVRWLHGRHGRGQAADGSLAFDVIVVNDVTRRREVDRLKTDFISTVSHELRTPLTPIKGFAALLLRRGDELTPPRRREALSTILDHTEHLGRLVEDLLLASTMSGEGERRMPALRTQPVPLAGVLEKTQRTFRAARPHREVIVECRDGVRAMGDSLRVEQIVANLVSNALKFSDDGTPVTVTACLAGSEAVIEVRDHGCGIPAGKHEEIFERFRRLEDPLVMETGGAGLGLYIARKLARGMSGDITVESEPGRGSVFRVHLPRAAAQSAGTAAIAG